MGEIIVNKQLQELLEKICSFDIKQKDEDTVDLVLTDFIGTQSLNALRELVIENLFLLTGKTYQQLYREYEEYLYKNLLEESPEFLAEHS